MSTVTVAEGLPGVRRVVTGHREDGVAIVKSDSFIPPIEISKVPGVKFGPLWKTGSLPVSDNNDETDGATLVCDGDLGIVRKAGTNLQFTDLAPGATAPSHRTSSLDHNILVSGSVILVLDDGSETLVDQPGDVIIQRGTIHAWKNPGATWARWITVLIDAHPAVVNGVGLSAKGVE